MNGLRYFVRVGISLAAVLGLNTHCDCIARDVNFPSALSFNDHVKPILSDKCFRCHGPDDAEREAGLRLDVFESATKELDSGSRAIVPGSPDESELVRRIEAEDADERMPPPGSNKSLSAAERATLRAWIKDGAEFTLHWSFIPPKRPRPPTDVEDTWSRNPIDRFVLRRIRRAKLEPTREADRRTLIRRLSFDLMGLPPTIEEVETFLNDRSTDAYERVVDRLLSSPRYGERMASHWLDLARYADSDGYEKDSHRQMWPYRDWVIEAYNANMPFDRFTIEQLAGDLLPGSSQSQKIASAFNRNGPTTSEGGANPDEYAAKYAVDRVTTTSTVWLGLTMQCAECHDHKFDPLPTKDFYQLFAFFNQIPEEPLHEGAASPPSIPVPTSGQSEAYNNLDERLLSLRAEAEGIEMPAVKRADVRDALIGEYTFDEPNSDQSNDTSGKDHQAHFSVANIEEKPSPQRSATPLARGVLFRGGGVITCGSEWELDRSGGISYGAWVKPVEQGGVVLSKIDPERGSRGFDLSVQQGRAIARVIDRWPDAAIEVTTAATYTPGEWVHVLVVWDGGSRADSVRIFFNGEEQPLEVKRLAGEIEDIGGDHPVLIGCRAAEESPMHGWIDEVRIYDRALTARDVTDLIEFSASRIVGTPSTERSSEQAHFLANCYRTSKDDSRASLLRVQLADCEAEQALLREEIPQVRVMKAVDKPRSTFILVRGDFRRPGEQVDPAIPAVLGALPESRAADRLALAEWMVGDNNPLNARVTVNRLWALLFGRGIVSTLDDFGSRGAPPTHPELLDWLAVEFVSSGWDTKSLLKRIVMSSTYQQSSLGAHKSWEADRDNLLLARGPRFRMPVEMLRDSVLFVSGLLQEHVGGPSVFPYHPPGLWEELAWVNSPWKSWRQNHGRDLYRRSLYTFWKRSLLHPAYSIFDAPARNLCEVERPITNTPLQALVTLNEPSFVEAARALAERVIQKHPDDDTARIDYTLRLVLSRPPHDLEAEALLTLARRSHDRYQQRPELAEEFLSVGEAPRRLKLDAVEYATWTTVAQAVLNLDETLTKE